MSFEALGMSGFEDRFLDLGSLILDQKSSYYDIIQRANRYLPPEGSAHVERNIIAESVRLIPERTHLKYLSHKDCGKKIQKIIPNAMRSGELDSSYMGPHYKLEFDENGLFFTSQGSRVGVQQLERDGPVFIVLNDDPSRKLCEHIGCSRKPCPYSCKKCGAQNYCCKSCQISDWDVHRKYCKVFSAL